MLWEELTAKEFEAAREQTQGTCILPFGVIEKHGTHLPLGTDMFQARKIAVEAAKIEPAVVFPFYFFGQINEAKHVPGTIAVSPVLMYNLFNEMCNEIARNGFKKIMILNFHGGNTSFIHYFLQCTLYEKRDYAVYGIEPFNGIYGKWGHEAEKVIKEIKDMFQSESLNSDHGGNTETSNIMAINRELVKMDQVERDGIEGNDRLDFLESIHTPIWWYAKHPAHFAGEPYHASVKAGEMLLDLMVRYTVDALRTIKGDQLTQALQDEFFNRCDKEG